MKAIGVLIALSAVLSAWCTVPEYRVECVVWEEVTHIMNHNVGSKMSCTKNAQCTGFDCNGLFEYQGIYSMNQIVNFTYCFGIAIHPCHKPLNLHIYLDIGQDVHFQRNVSRTSDIQVPGFHSEMPKIGQVDGFIHVDMNRKTILDHRYAEIGMKFKIRVTGSSGGMGVWPESLQQTLMPTTDIPIPDCEPGVVTPPHNPATCVIYVGPKTTPPTSKPTASPLLKPCEPYVAYGCTNNTMCDVIRKVCVCQSNYHFYGNVCVENTHKVHISTTPYFIPSPINATIVSGGSEEVINLKPIVIGVGVACVVVIMGTVSAVLFVRYRKHQARYANHQLLINNEEANVDEDDDDDDPIDVST